MKAFVVTERTALIPIGKQGENNAVSVLFKVDTWRAKYGEGGTFTLNHKRATDTISYPVITTLTDDGVLWQVSNADNAVVGYGECELRYSIDNIVKKSLTWKTKTVEALTPRDETPPDPYESWYDNVLDASGAARASASEAEEYANSAEESAEDASESATAARASEDNAKASETAAGGYADSAEVAKNTAVGAKDAALEAAQRAESAEDNAEAAKSAAQTAAGVAESAKTEAVSAKNTAVNASGAAQNYATSAESAKNTAVSASQTATTKSGEASASARNAASSAQSASQSAQNAAASATAAATSETNASTSATAASQSAAAASASATNAAESELAAQGYAEEAEAASVAIFIAEYGVTSYNEITEAINAGKTIFARYNNGVFPYFSQNGGAYWFCGVRRSSTAHGLGFDPDIFTIYVSSNNTWSYTLDLPVLYFNDTVTLRGKLTLGATPTADMDATTKKYVDDAIADLPLSVESGLLCITFEEA